MLKWFLTSVIFCFLTAFTSLYVHGDATDRELSDRVARILKKTPLIDGHNDLPWRYRIEAGNRLSSLDIATDLSQLERPTHTDLRRLRQGRLGGQFWSVYIPIREYGGAAGDVRTVLEQIDLVHRMVARYPQSLEFAYTAADIRRIHRQGRIASLIGIEGGHSIDDSLGVLRMLYLAGARYMTLTHSLSIRWADSATDDPRHDGLTAFGQEVVLEMNRIGMMVDLSHVSATTMHDALDVTSAPVIFSHSSARAVVNHQRNVPDDVLRRIADNGGVVMVTFFPFYVSEDRRLYQQALSEENARLDAAYPENKDTVKVELDTWVAARTVPQPTLQQVADHIDHIRGVAGIEYIGIGGDYDGMPTPPTGLEDVSAYPNLFVELLKRGYRDRDIAAIAGENVLRVMTGVEKVAERLRDEREPSEALIDELDKPAPSEHLTTGAARGILP